MKSWQSILAIGCMSMAFGAAAQPVPGGPCRAKYDSISAEIEQAKAHDQKYRLRGLQRAQNEVVNHCRDDKLVAEHGRKIARQEKVVAERQRELAEAQQKGASKDKLARRASKLQAAQDELQRLKASGPA
ncbi:DUF1090 domain-containing protein [Variovorax sp. J22P168]|uniref:DUF1090 domain-containing protein n=1 Tax=Variovorax jilinensis TaxID=3053513 RepID=UPI0025785473|nr:DUF1090 domain-containing protein [Variovorax sp. J22P168]MDM0013130.1 DUF1090 domain-containing protein [Variovorax sp. J22P168]